MNRSLLMRRTGGRDAFPQPGDAERQPEAMAQFARPPRGEPAHFAGRWTNDLGSVLDFAIDGGTASGRIELRSDSPEGAGGVVADLRGMVEETTIALVSRWKGRACLGVLIGDLVKSDGQDVILLSWELVRHLDDPDMPMDVTMGQVMFTRVPSH